MKKQSNSVVFGILGTAIVLGASALWSAENGAVPSIPTQSVMTSPSPQPPAPESLVKPEHPVPPGTIMRDKNGVPLLLVEFKTDRYDIRPAFLPQVNAFGNYLRQHPDTQAILSGHADDSGHGPANESLSKKRADAVLAYLVDHYGIAASRISAEGYGAKTDKPDNSTVRARQDDRRVFGRIITL